MRKLTLGLLKAAAGRFLVETVVPACQVGTTSYEEETLATTLRKAFVRYVGSSFGGDDTDPIPSSDEGVAFPSLATDFRVAPGARLRFGDGSLSWHHKIRGFNHNLLVMVPSPVVELSTAVFIDHNRTADFQTTLGIRDIMRRNGNLDDIVAFLEERRIGANDDERLAAAGAIISSPPRLGYLTYSLGDSPCIRFGHVLDVLRAGRADGMEFIRPEARVHLPQAVHAEAPL